MAYGMLEEQPTPVGSRPALFVIDMSIASLALLSDVHMGLRLARDNFAGEARQRLVSLRGLAAPRIGQLGLLIREAPEERRRRLTTSLLGSWSTVLPQRIADEDLGDYAERVDSL